MIIKHDFIYDYVVAVKNSIISTDIIFINLRLIFLTN